MITRTGAPIVVLLALTTGCTNASDPVSTGGSGSGGSQPLAPTENWARDILSTGLDVDLSTNRATAFLEFAPGDADGATLEAYGLTIDAVSNDAGPVPYRVVDGQLDLGVAASDTSAVRIDYRFARHENMNGVFGDGTTLTWPYYCSNVFPCQSNPADGLTFSLSVHGAPAGLKLIHPTSIPNDAPSYMAAWAVGDYTTVDLGTTKHGRTVRVHHLTGEAAAAAQGTQHLVAAFEWLESTYGDYSFGSEVGSVSVDWGAGDLGGMEHHPLWHVATGSMDSEEVHVHEAAHGWYGDGVRIACWEDLVLSEGTTSYLAARAIEAVAGKAAGDAIWGEYEGLLEWVIANEDRVALLETCNAIDVLTDLWNLVVYMKGAYFYRAIEDAVGREALDGALASFYAAHRNKAVRMTDMLAHLKAETGFDATALADGWLRSLGRPDQ